ncbi:MAG: TolC family protein [Alphaproteobacteria bacterium]|nr:TolC family protein [Alphaproteobacteria bacterium]
MSPPLRVAALLPWLLGAALPDPCDRMALVTAVLEANPTVDAAEEAARAALSDASAPAGPDPMVMLGTAPLSLGSEHIGVSASVTQRIVLSGRVHLQRLASRAAAAASEEGVEDTRRALALAAAQTWDDWWRLRQERALIDDHRALAEQLRVSATGRYTVGRAPQSAPLGAEVLLASIDLDVLEADAAIATVEARMRALLHVARGEPLPAPAETTPPSALAEPEDVDRPDLRALGHTAEADEERVRAARRAGVPDLTVGTSYSTMWPMPEHRWMVELGAEVPLHVGARRAEVDAASARLAATRATATALEDRADAEVEAARLGAVAAADRWALLDERLLPLARQRLEASRIAFETGAGGFDDVVDAERALLDAERAALDATAAFHQQRAAMEAASGRIAGGAP